MMSIQLGTLGAWFNPVYDDVARHSFVIEAEALGYTAAWLGVGTGAGVPAVRPSSSLRS